MLFNKFNEHFETKINLKIQNLSLWIIILLINVFACCQLAYSRDIQIYEIEVFSEALKFINSKKYDVAKKCLLKIDKKNLSRTGKWKYYDYLGYCEEKLGNYDAAIKNFRKCIDLYYSNKDAYISLWVVYTKMRDYESANKIAQQIIELFPEDERGYLYTASYYREKAYDNEAAYQILKEGIEVVGKTERLQLALLNTYLSMGRYESAFEIANDMLKNKQELDNRSLVDLYRACGYYYYAIGMYPKSTEQCQLALTYADKDYQKRVIYFLSFWPKVIPGEYDNALEILKTLDKLVDKTSPMYVETCIAYSHLFYYTGDMDKAISFCQIALEKSKDLNLSLQRARAYYMIILLYNYRKDFKKRDKYIKECLKFLKREIKKYPKSYEHKICRAGVLLTSDSKWKTAGVLIDELIKERAHSKTFIFKGLYEKKKGKLNEAVKWFIQAKQAYPRENEWHALINLSKIHRELGQYDLALQNCKDALAINPNNRFVKDEIKIIEKERVNKK